MIFIAGPGHGGPAWWPTRGLRAPTASFTRTSPGTPTAWRRCSASSPSPAGSPATSRPETPGSIHEGGELGYSLAHAYGAVFDNPDLIAACVIGDGEAETGPLAASWHSNKFLNPVTRRRGAADPAPERLQDRQPDRARPHPRARAGRAHERLRVPRPPSSPATTRPLVHQQLAADARRASRRDRTTSRRRARDGGDRTRPQWPMIVLRTPKGWTGPEDRRRPAGRGHLPRPPGPHHRRARQPRAPGASSRSGCGPTGPRSCSTRTGRCVPSWPRSPPRATGG